MTFLLFVRPCCVDRGIFAGTLPRKPVFVAEVLNLIGCLPDPLPLCADLGFVDRFSGTLIITGRVAEVESSFNAISDYFKGTLGFTVCDVTKT